MAVHMISMEQYQMEILTGFVVSAGGLGESLVLLIYSLLTRLAPHPWH